jgi:fluoroquinolone resistance protein
MEKPYIIDQEYNKIIHALPPGEYENCVFRNCDLSDDSLSEYFFIDCVFESCNLSAAKLSGTAFRHVSFRNSKLLGLDFSNCSKMLFEVGFEDCRMNMCGFYKWNLKKTVFRKCNLGETDFAEADLTEVVFDDCDLSGAIFDQTILLKADLRKAWNFIIDPAKNTIKKARFSAHGLPGLLSGYDIVIDD